MRGNEIIFFLNMLENLVIEVEIVDCQHLAKGKSILRIGAVGKVLEINVKFFRFWDFITY